MAAAALLAGVVAGCSSDSTSPTAETTGTTAAPTAGTDASTDAEQIVQESAKTTETLHSVHVSLTADNLPKLPVESVEADVTNLPEGSGQAVGVADFRTDPNAPFIETQFLAVDGTMYTKQAEGAQYVAAGPAEKIYDPGVVLDKNIGLANVLKNVQDPTVEGNETIDGVDTVKISGTIDASVIDPIVPTIGEGGGTLPITLWIAETEAPATPTSALPSDAPSPGTGPNLVRVVVAKGDGSMDVTLSKWAEPVEIPKP